MNTEEITLKTVYDDRHHSYDNTITPIHEDNTCDNFRKKYGFIIWSISVAIIMISAIITLFVMKHTN